MQRDREIELEPVAKSKGVNKSIASFLGLGNIVEGRPLPELLDDNIDYALNMSNGALAEILGSWIRDIQIVQTETDLVNNTWIITETTSTVDYYTTVEIVDDSVSLVDDATLSSNDDYF